MRNTNDAPLYEESRFSPTSEACEPRTLGAQNLLSWAGSARKAHHTRIPGANLAKNAAEEAGREGGGASRRAALNGVARDSPGLVHQGVGVRTSAMSGMFGDAGCTTDM